MGTRVSTVMLALAVLVLAPGPATGLARPPQNRESSVKAHLTTGVVKLGAALRLVVTVEDARGASIGELPQVEGLLLGPVGAPTQQSMTLRVNGRLSSSNEITWSIPVQPLKLGDFVIPPIDVDLGGRSGRTPELALTVVEDLRGEELGFFEIASSSSRVVEGQPFSLELLFGWDAALSGKINHANLSLPWWGQLPGALEMETPPGRAGVREFDFLLNSSAQVRVEEAEPVERRGRSFRTFRLVRSFTPTRSGALEFPTSFFEFGRVKETRDFFRTRAEKVESYFVRADGFEIDVVALPEEGRPLDFSGAIGQLRASAEADPRDVDVGDSIKLTVEWTGPGNLEFFTPPDPGRLEAFREFRLYGRNDQKEFDRRRVVYDLSPLTSQVRQIPPLPLTVYDPASERYTSVVTQPIEIRVRPLEAASGLSGEESAERFEKQVLDLRTQLPPARAPSRSRAPLTGALLAGLPLAWLGLRTLVRRQGDPAAPVERRRRGARRQLARALARSSDPKQQLDALHEFLAARSRERSQAWVGRDPAEHLPGEPAERLASLIRELEAAAYGHSAESRGGVSAEAVLEVADACKRGGL